MPHSSTLPSDEKSPNTALKRLVCILAKQAAREFYAAQDSESQGDENPETTDIELNTEGQS